MPTINDNQANLVLAKDYRTGCGLNRKYGDATGTTWATHPAFTFGNKELNGIWVGKFETTGSSAEPTIKPNNYHKVATVGEAFDIAKSIGTTDNVAKNYGNGGSTFGKHNLQSATTHMLKNSEWGAATYLSSSMYGAGVNNVQINASEDNGDSSNDGDGRDSASITGCGPSANGNTSAYECSGKTDHRYQSAIGQLASTTGNVYGIYDMAGGAWEYVMGSRSEAAEEATGSGYITGSVKPPYVDLYPTASAKGKFGSPATWSGDTSMEYLYNNDQCEWNTCGGQALHETKIVQSISSRNQSWGNSYADFVHSSHPWFYRGGGWRNASSASLYYLHYGYGGYDGDDDGFRVSLLVTQ